MRPVDTRAFIARTSFVHMMVFCTVNICAIVAAAAGAIVCLAGNNCDVVYSAVAFMALVTVCIGGYGTDSRFPVHKCSLIYFYHSVLPLRG